MARVRPACWATRGNDTSAVPLWARRPRVILLALPVPLQCCPNVDTGSEVCLVAGGDQLRGVGTDATDSGSHRRGGTGVAHRVQQRGRQGRPVRAADLDRTRGPGTGVTDAGGLRR